MAETYELAVHDRSDHEHLTRYTSEDSLEPGSVLVLGGRFWLVTAVDGTRADAAPARYRLTLRHPDGREETGAFRRFRPDAPLVGHQFTTLEDGAPVSWSVVEQRLAEDEAGEAFLETVAERDYEETGSLPDHELEHALERDGEPSDAAATLARAEEAGLSVELVALEAGQAPDWDEAARFVDALVLVEIGDDLLELCGVNPRVDPEDSWLDQVHARLRDDLASFRADVDDNHDEVEEWDFRGGRVFAAVGTTEDEANPLVGYGWLVRLLDAGALGAAGFQRIRKADVVF